jgi:hypothetical protein
MKTRRYLTSIFVVLASAVLATLSFVSCQQSQTRTAAPAAESKAVSTEKVFVEFRGPWAFVPDPKDTNSVLAIAPKAKGHRDLYVQASNQSTLAPGVHDLSLPAHSGSAAATADPSIAQAKIDAQSLQRALDNKSARYVIRLPKPEEYVVSGRHRSRLGVTYPPDASTEKAYATALSLRYNVSSLNGFSLAGAPDSGTFNPLLLQVETPMIRFVIEPAQEDDPQDKCDTHSRESFHQLTALLRLTLYVDFPDNPGDCHKSDPQNAHPAQAEGSWRSPIEEITALLWGGNMADVQTASVAGGATAPADLGFLVRWDGAKSIEQRLLAVVYLFGHPGGDCFSPNLILTITP